MSDGKLIEASVKTLGLERAAYTNVPLERPRTNQDKPRLEKHFKIQTKLQESNSTFITYCLNTAFLQMCSIVVEKLFPGCESTISPNC